MIMKTVEGVTLSRHLLCIVVALIVWIESGRAEEADSIELCKMEDRKGIDKMREKYKSNIQNWKALHDRACQAKVSIDDANKGLDQCLQERFAAMEEGRFKQVYQEAYDKCMKKIAPIKEMCDSTEQKERIYCVMVEGRKKFAELCPMYIEQQEQQRALFRMAFKCLDDKLKERSV